MARVSDRRPPPRILRVVNPVVRSLVMSPVGRVMPIPVAVLQFAGRKSGRTYRVVVGWYDVDSANVVFSSGRWGVNFRGGIPVVVIHRGRRLHGTGMLVEDPERVARALQRVLDSGVSARQLGLRVPRGHRLTAEDIRATKRGMIRFDLTGPAAA